MKRTTIVRFTKAWALYPRQLSGAKSIVANTRSKRGLCGHAMCDILACVQRKITLDELEYPYRPKDGR